MICLLAGCGKTEQGSRSDSDPFTWGFGYVHGQNEFFRSLLEMEMMLPRAILRQLLQRFLQQRRQASQRGIQWQLDYWEWLRSGRTAAICTSAAGIEDNGRCAASPTSAPMQARTSGSTGWKPTPARARSPNAASAPNAKPASTEALQRGKCPRPSSAPARRRPAVDKLRSFLPSRAATHVK